MSSERGVQQGDPLGPAFFSLAVHSAILEAKAATDAAMPGALDLAGTDRSGGQHFLGLFAAPWKIGACLWRRRSSK